MKGAELSSCNCEAFLVRVTTHQIDYGAHALTALWRFAEAAIDFGNGAGALGSRLLNLLFRKSVAKANIHDAELPIKFATYSQKT